MRPIVRARGRRIPRPGVDAKRIKLVIEFVELTKQHKVLLAVVGLGVGAVAVDRLILGSGISGPSEVGAAIIERPSTPKAAFQPAQSSSLSMAERVDALEDAEASRTDLADAFRASAGLSVSDAPTIGNSAAKADAFRLSSVMTRPVPAAVVNGHMLRSGHEYAFSPSASGLWTLLKDDEVAARQRGNPSSIRAVRLESVQARTATTPGSAVITVDGSERYELVIQASEK
jgi:hypothetical protein